MAETPFEPADVDDRMVEIVGGDRAEWRGFVGRAVAAHEHGWIAVHLDAVNPEDDRTLYPLGVQDVILRPDLED